MEKIDAENKKDQYCILFREIKGYYLSKVSIAESMKLTIIDKGEKKYCLNKINQMNLKVSI